MINDIKYIRQELDRYMWLTNAMNNRQPLRERLWYAFSWLGVALNRIDPNEQEDAFPEVDIEPFRKYTDYQQLEYFSRELRKTASQIHGLHKAQELLNDEARKTLSNALETSKEEILDPVEDKFLRELIRSQSEQNINVTLEINLAWQYVQEVLFHVEKRLSITLPTSIKI